MISIYPRHLKIRRKRNFEQDCGAKQPYMGMHRCRFKRLTNPFSEKVESHAHAVALHFMYHNFCKQHKAHRVTAAGVAIHCGVADIVKVLEN